ncbi:ATP-binding cassette domain-containing protein [Methylomonas koyamae]|uniref:ATP-binding cassette domain-containing protein n=1 Tax=Methylomonas koyamae TaxID=702114 RepID=UPI001C332BB3|nr:ABC transporter ATP-binding protein [Methylomonas koyamae]BBL58189.1 ABC transporter [Methylomonas koyamae]
MASHDPLQRLKQLILIEREDIGSLVAYGVGIGLMSLATPVAVQALVNTIAFGALLQPLVVLTLILLVLLSFSNSLVALQFYVVEMLQRRLFVRLFGEAAERLRNAAITVRDQQYLPELANRFFDVVSLQKTAASLLLETLGYLLQTLIGMLLLAFYHPLLLAFDLFLVAALYLILFVMGKQGIPTAIEQSRAKYTAAAWLENIAANPLLGKSRRGEDFVNQQTERIARHYLAACVNHFRILSRQNIGALVLHTLANTALLGMGGWMVIERQLSLGQLIAAELVVNAMVYGLTRLGKTLDNFYELVASVDKIGYLLDLPQEAGHGGQPQHFERGCRVEIRQLCLPDTPYSDPANRLDLTLEPGERLAISTGAERGTLLDAIFGLRAASSGQILLNGEDLRDLSLRYLRDSIGLVRHAELVEATVAENLSLGSDLALADMRRALDQVGLLETISALPDGLNTALCPHGAPLSEEQALRLTLARAIAVKPQLLLIDKALDRIDARYLPGILECLTAADAPWSLLVISHEPLVLARFRRQAVLVEGRLQETLTEGA